MADTDDEGTDTDASRTRERTGAGAVEAEAVEAAGPDEFGLVQIWWGDGKGKTTAAMGMGFRAAGHGFRVHMLQFMKGGTASVEDIRGEYNAMAAMPGISYENTGHYGWHGRLDDSDEDEHVAKARAGLERTRQIVAATGDVDLSSPIDLDAPPEAGVHMLVLDEILYAANRDLIDPDDVVDLVDSKPDGLELVLTGGHEKPDYISDHADLITNVKKEKHPFSRGYAARKGTEY
jgi:cob(I)alamin adenosyltransferase